MARIVDRTRETANDRFKRSFGGWFWGSVMLAAVFHFALLEYFPKLTAADLCPRLRSISHRRRTRFAVRRCPCRPAWISTKM
jgi:hypothetical protein